MNGCTLISIFGLICLGGWASSESLPEGGQNSLSGEWVKAAKWLGGPNLAKAEPAVFGGGRSGYRVEVLNDRSGRFQLQLSVPVTGNVKQGDTMLLTFEARCLTGSSVDGMGGGSAVVEIKESPHYPKLGQDVFSCGSEWQRIAIAFRADLSAKDGVTWVSLMLGGKKQTLEIADLKLLDYGPDFPLEKLPHPKIDYPGREPGAAWRKEALERIERIRTTPIEVEIVDEAGKPLPEVAVSLVLKRHAFAFGTAVKAKWLMGSGERSEKYRDVVDQNFSAIVLENDLKPFGWEGGKSNDGAEYRMDWTRGALTWANERNLKVRGHYLLWGPWEPWSEELKEQPAAIRKKVMSHLEEVLTGVGGLVDEWDAVNHPVGWENPRRTVDQAVGSAFYADIFRAARQRTRVPLWINEDQVFRPGRQQEEFYACIQELIANGEKPDGIGNQAHFHSSFLPPPEEMLRISDRFAALVPNLELTEFDVITNGDEQLQADWLRDVLIMTYSHPAYSGMFLWVFWEGAGWKPEAALWRKDWTEKPNATAWRKLVCEQWRTRVSGKTDKAGLFSTRGHRGRYEISAEVAGQKLSQVVNTEGGSGRFRLVFAGKK